MDISAVTTPATNGNVIPVEQQFNAAVSVIRSLPKKGSFQPSHAMLLKFYSFYKQAVEGKCSIPSPYRWNVVEKAKWDAWSKLGDMSKEEAMRNYVDELKKIIETMPHTSDVDRFLDKLGGFYESAPDHHQNGGTVENGFVAGGGGSVHCNGADMVDNNNLYLLTHSKAKIDRIDSQMRDFEHEINNQSKSPICSNGTINGEGDSEAEDEFCDTEDSILSPKDDQNDTLGAASMELTPTAPQSYGPVVTQHQNLSYNPPQQAQPQQSNLGNSGYFPPYQWNMSPGASGGSGHPPPNPYLTSLQIDAHDQMRVALLRLQEDMTHVTMRLNTLETLVLMRNQIRSRRPSSEDERQQRYDGSSWWPFRAWVPFRVFLFVILWPLILKWFPKIVRFLVWRKRKRLN